jgi:hypothetical protein
MVGLRRLRRSRAERIAIAVGGLAALAFPTWLLGGAYMKHRAERIALAKEWSIDGHPCPQVTADEFRARRLRAPKGLVYENATVFRQFGHMSCSPIAYHGGGGFGSYAVCQFTGPNVLLVKTRKGEWFFVPGPGQPATIATPHDEAHCVLASNFTL